ncbi:NnrU family protein [Celeribacter sp.]|uniref:NnrU family protein n=1 Tax=Celeribacter sp. TaxID=1890673 RepID=UPI003A938E53
MTLLSLGLLLWVAAHLFKRLAPEVRGSMGKTGKGLVAVGIGAGLILMVLGYRMSETYDLYALPPFLRHVNNTLMVIAVFLFALGHSKSRLRAKMRHPMLTSVVVWGVAHLLVNSDAASLVLFGGMTLWALVEMTLINRAGPAPEPYKGGSLAGDIRLVVISLVVFGAIAGVHIWLGYNPFPM